jgi:hypothetical protein
LSDPPPRRPVLLPIRVPAGGGALAPRPQWLRNARRCRRAATQPAVQPRVERTPRGTAWPLAQARPERFGIVRATKDVESHLRIAPGADVLKLNRIVETADDAPVEWRSRLGRFKRDTLPRNGAKPGTIDATFAQTSRCPSASVPASCATLPLKRGFRGLPSAIEAHRFRIVATARGSHSPRRLVAWELMMGAGASPFRTSGLVTECSHNSGEGVSMAFLSRARPAILITSLSTLLISAHPMDCRVAYKVFWQDVSTRETPPGRLAATSRSALRIYDACQTGHVPNPESLFERLKVAHFKM